MSDDPALSRLEQIDHIIVLMMENRSFDHMLGYLSLAADDQYRGGGRTGQVDGLRNEDEDQNRFRDDDYCIKPFHEGGLTKVQDPGHLGWQVGQQMAHGMQGFVENYATTRAYQDPGDVMRYQTAAQVPVYDWMAENFAVLDRWFCSVPGSTWPNRLSALAGEACDKDNKFPPLYDRRSFVHNLDEAYSWRWYSTDPGSLRIVDGDFRVGHEDHFAFTEKPTLVQKRTFYTDVMAGELPNVAWIDPNFVDLGGLGGANDDHPPTDVMAGQSLVLKIYQALSQSQLWHKSLLVITYDEHGGFYDHVDPRDMPPAFTERAEFGHFGPRVPALVVSPFVQARQVYGSPQGEDVAFMFDHTSLIRTILERFGKQEGRFDGLPKRVRTASHLGHVLSDDPPRGRVEVDNHTVALVANWWAGHIATQLSYPLATVPALAELGLGDKQTGAQATAMDIASLIGRGRDWAIGRLFPRVAERRQAQRRRCGEDAPRRGLGVRLPWAKPKANVTALPEADEFQQGVLAAAKEIRRLGLPSGQP